jgi:predicted TIM-barrel fold metal-dependent hydrolase
LKAGWAGRIIGVVGGWSLAASRHGREDFAGKTIDGHTHMGVSLKAYALGEYPYAATAEGLAARQMACGVDVMVSFPFSADLYFEPAELARGNAVPAGRPLSAVPYAAENRLLMREVFDYCPEISDRFLPFVCVDPGREQKKQVAELTALAKDYPVYGVKIVGVLCQSRVTELFGAGSALLDWAEERGLGVLFHTSTIADEYSGAEDVFRVVESRPAMRFCLAHCILFHEGYLERAAAMPSVWVDTAAMKIQVEVARQLVESGELRGAELLDVDLNDHLAVMRAICGRWPDMIVWGSDAPAYSYICRRKQGADDFREFRLKATYEDEVAALTALSPELRAGVGGANVLDFIYGRG